MSIKLRRVWLKIVETMKLIMSPMLGTSIWFPTTVLVNIGSMTSIVTSVIFILIIIVYLFILFFLLRGRGKWLRLLLWFGFTFTFLSTSTSCLVLLNGLGQLAKSWDWDCAMCEYKLVTAPAPCAIGGAIANGSHHHIICFKFLAFLVTSSQLCSIIRCVCIMVGIVSMNFSVFECSYCCSMLCKVSTRSICSLMSVFFWVKGQIVP